MIVAKVVQSCVTLCVILQDILKHSERAGQDCGQLQKALHVMQVVPKAANDMMNVGRLCGFDVRFINSLIVIVNERLNM